MQSLEGKRAALVLSGGAALGLTHIGVYRALCERGVEVALVTGVSAGAVEGALIASGHSPEEVAEFHQGQDWLKLIRPEFFNRLGALNYIRMENLLQEHAGYSTIEDLPVTYAAACTDLEGGDPVLLTEGKLGQAARASSAVPGIFPPVEVGGRLLVDGGIYSNLPLWTVDELEAEAEFDFVVASDPLTNLAVERADSYRDILQIAFVLVLKSTTEKMLPPERDDVLLVQPELEWTPPIDLKAIDRLMQAGFEATLPVLDAVDKRAEG